MDDPAAYDVPLHRVDAGVSADWEGRAAQWGTWQNPCLPALGIGKESVDRRASLGVPVMRSVARQIVDTHDKWEA